jgi:hypothetical protein
MFDDILHPPRDGESLSEQDLSNYLDQAQRISQTLPKDPSSQSQSRKSAVDWWNSCLSTHHPPVQEALRRSISVLLLDYGTSGDKISEKLEEEIYLMGCKTARSWCRAGDSDKADEWLQWTNNRYIQPKLSF